MFVNLPKFVSDQIWILFKFEKFELEISEFNREGCIKFAYSYDFIIVNRLSWILKQIKTEREFVLICFRFHDKRFAILILAYYVSYQMIIKTFFTNYKVKFRSNNSGQQSQCCCLTEFFLTNKKFRERFLKLLLLSVIYRFQSRGLAPEEPGLFQVSCLFQTEFLPTIKNENLLQNLKLKSNYFQTLNFNMFLYNFEDSSVDVECFPWWSMQTFGSISRYKAKKNGSKMDFLTHTLTYNFRDPLSCLPNAYIQDKNLELDVFKRFYCLHLKIRRRS
jgi:hypothetical protein